MSLLNTHYQELSNEGQKIFSKIYKNRNRNKLYEQLQKSHGPLQNNEEYHPEVGPTLNSNGHPVAFTSETTWSKRKKQNSLLQQSQNKDNGVGVGVGVGISEARQGQEAQPEFNLRRLDVPPHLDPRQSQQPQQLHVINETTNNRIMQLKPNTLKKVKTQLNKITNQSNKNTVIGKIKTESHKITGELDESQKDEIEKGILEILGGSKKEEAVKKKPSIIFIIVIVLLVVGGIVAVIILVAVPAVNKEIDKIREKWPENRCKYPYVNFPSIFGPEGLTAEENKAYCDAEAANAAYNSNIGGVQNQIDEQNKSMNNMSESLNNTQTMILGLRDSLMKTVNDMYQKMYSMFKRIAYLFKVFTRLFYRIFQTFNSLFKTIKYAVWTLMSVWTGPIGGLVRAFCFGCHTLIELDGKLKRLDEIIIGDNISGDIVVGVCEFKKDTRDQYYKMGDVYVSGMHIVEHDRKFIRVHNHPRAVRVDYNLPIIRCLITDTGRLRIRETVYCDYLGDNVLETYLKIVAPIVKIPFQLDDYKNSALNLYPAFTQDSIIQFDSGIKLITDVVIGDKIAGKEVIGVIRYILEGKTFITEYDDGYNMCKFVGIQIYRGDKYSVRENHREMKILGKLECIGLVVEGGVIEFSRNMMLVDFDIIGDDLRRDVEDALEKLYLD
jgi:hypothetical protein